MQRTVPSGANLDPHRPPVLEGPDVQLTAHRVEPSDEWAARILGGENHTAAGVEGDAPRSGGVAGGDVEGQRPPQEQLALGIELAKLADGRAREEDGAIGRTNLDVARTRRGNGQGPFGHRVVLGVETTEHLVGPGVQVEENSRPRCGDLERLRVREAECSTR